MRDEQMDGGSDSPVCSSDGAVRKYRDRESGCAAQERDDVQPAPGLRGVKI